MAARIFPENALDEVARILRSTNLDLLGNPAGPFLEEWTLTEHGWTGSVGETMRLLLSNAEGDQLVVEIPCSNFQREIGRVERDADGFDELVADLTSLVLEAVVTSAPGTGHLVLPPY